MNNISKHIQNGAITVKSKKQSDNGSKTPSKTRSRSHKDYQLYLQSGVTVKPEITKPETKPETKPGTKPETKSKDVFIQRNQKPKKESTIRIIKQENKKKSKHKFTRKKPSKIKDINEIEKQINKSIKESNKSKSINQRDIKRPIKRNSRRSIKRHSQRSTHKHKNSRKISIKHKKVTTKDINKVEEKIAFIRNKKTSDIKKELEKEGIKVSGKSNRLLKDIYFYSKICNINIQHEK